MGSPLLPDALGRLSAAVASAAILQLEREICVAVRGSRKIRSLALGLGLAKQIKDDDGKILDPRCAFCFGDHCYRELFQDALVDKFSGLETEWGRGKTNAWFKVVVYHWLLSLNRKKESRAKVIEAAQVHRPLADDLGESGAEGPDMPPRVRDVAAYEEYGRNSAEKGIEADCQAEVSRKAVAAVIAALPDLPIEQRVILKVQMRHTLSDEECDFLVGERGDGFTVIDLQMELASIHAQIDPEELLPLSALEPLFSCKRNTLDRRVDYARKKLAEVVRDSVPGVEDYFCLRPQSTRRTRRAPRKRREERNR